MVVLQPGTVTAPLHAVGGFYAFAIDVARMTFRRPVSWREFVDQSWFLVRVTMIPAVVFSLPFTGLVIFALNSLLGELGAQDLSGAGAGLGVLTQVGPICTVLVVAGAGATAICADLGARTIREEIDAMEVLGIDPVQRLVVPRVAALTFIAFLINGLVNTIGLLGAFFFSVYLQGVTPGAWVSSLTLLAGTADVVVSEIKAAAFGMAGAVIACYRGLATKGGPKGVGDAVNETVVYAFMALVAINLIITAVSLKITVG